MINQIDWAAWSDERNVIDEFKGLPDETIVQTLKDRALPYAVLMDHLLGDFNLGTVIRNANAFSAREVFYLGKKKVDRRGALGTYKYTPVTYLDSIDKVKELKKTYRLVALDNIQGSQPLRQYQWQQPSILVLGEEGRGIGPELLALCDDMVYIPQTGSVRSLNVGCASAIAMNDIMTKWK